MKTDREIIRRKSFKTFPKEGLAKVPQVCEFLNRKKSTVYAKIKSGEIQTVPGTGDKRVSWEWLWKYSRQQEPVAVG